VDGGRGGVHGWMRDEMQGAVVRPGSEEWR
jgi:hypothetical protein